MMTPLLGCIADDFTGATDLANNLVRAGMRTVQTIGVPESADAVVADAIVVALKSRTVPATDAVAQSLKAYQWLKAQGISQIYFKYCSTFDSTPAGNIGPVTDALLDAIHGEGKGFTIVCPAFPENQRTIFNGHLFVGEQLLSDSGMRDHPLTPHDRREFGARDAGSNQTARGPGELRHGVEGGGCHQGRISKLAGPGLRRRSH